MVLTSRPNPRPRNRPRGGTRPRSSIWSGTASRAFCGPTASGQRLTGSDLNGLDLPPEPAPEKPAPRRDAPSELDLERHGVTSILWANGFRPAFDWVRSEWS